MSMVAERSSALVLLSHSSSDAPIPILARRLGAKVAPRLLAALDFRLDQTLASVGHRFGVTRERARQLEQKGRAQIEPLVVAWAEAFQLEWAAQLGSLAVSEEELFGALRDPAIDTDSQNRLGRLALITLFPTAAHPSTFRGAEVEGWWTLDRLALPRALRSMTKSCPLNDEEFDALLTRLNVPQALPATSILQTQGGPVRYYPAVGAWVRARASHRDAAVWMLQEAGQPLAPADLANRLGLNAKALNANLARDRRVRQLRPTGLWTLLDWTSAQDDAEAFASTIDAVVAVLFEHGPLRRIDLVRRVIDAYPVSPWAVMNALESDRVGKTSSGTWDLTERGAVPATKPTPRKPRTVTETEDGRMLAFVRIVDAELMRGSGLPLSLYVAWRAGLNRPGDRRVFSSPIHAPATVRRSFGSCSISTLRQQAQELGAVLGDELVVTLEFTANEYHVRLVARARQREVGGSIPAAPQDQNRVD